MEMRKKNDGENILDLGLNKFYDNTFDELLKERKILINCGIDEGCIELISAQIMKFNKQDKDIPVEKRKPIYLLINSLGGEVFSGLNCCSLIKSSKTPVIGVVLAYAYSMGAVIFSACHKKLMFENSSILIHDGSTSLSGSANKVKDLQKFYNLIDNKIKDIIVSNSKISSEEYDANIDRELYMMAEECKEKGLCDSIIGIDIPLDEIL